MRVQLLIFFLQMHSLNESWYFNFSSKVLQNKAIELKSFQFKNLKETTETSTCAVRLKHIYQIS